MSRRSAGSAAKRVSAAGTVAAVLLAGCAKPTPDADAAPRKYDPAKAHCPDLTDAVVARLGLDGKPTRVTGNSLSEAAKALLCTWNLAAGPELLVGMTVSSMSRGLDRAWPAKTEDLAGPVPVPGLGEEAYLGWGGGLTKGTAEVVVRDDNLLLEVSVVAGPGLAADVTAAERGRIAEAVAREVLAAQKGA